jgi:serine/threonine protein kinase
LNPVSQLSAALAGRYEIEREIGAGGMATVYLARDVRHSRRVALKVLRPELGAVLGVDRFLSEIQVTANLQHPNLLPLFDSGEANGLLFYVMPFVEGDRSARDSIARSNCRSTKRCASLSPSRERSTMRTTRG